MSKEQIIKIIIVMSGYMFGFLNIHSGMVFARRLHMLSAYWGFMFMSFHLGQHWNFCIGTVKHMIHNVKENITIILGLTLFLFVML